MKNWHDTLKEILDLVGYTGDKEKFINTFIATAFESALATTLQNMPEDKRNTLKQALEKAADQNQANEMVGKEINAEEYKKTFQKATDDLFVEYVQTISPTLTSEVKDKLHSYLQAQA